MTNLKVERAMLSSESFGKTMSLTHIYTLTILHWTFLFVFKVIGQFLAHFNDQYLIYAYVTNIVILPLCLCRQRYKDFNININISFILHLQESLVLEQKVHYVYSNWNSSVYINGICME